MKISLDEVRRVAALAHLDLDPATEERLRGHLEQILDYVEQLNRLDTSDVPPAIGMTGGSPSFREDREGDSLGSEEALSNAPESGQGHFKVPRILPG
jgi:aspartyl-tRNA(Asn)/glutamyl-tRNA(Gln) amidotransferase subunit C